MLRASVCGVTNRRVGKSQCCSNRTTTSSCRFLRYISLGIGSLPRRSSLKTTLLAGITLSAILSCTAFAQTNYKIVDRIKVPDGGFDYATFDTATNRVLMARTDFTTVID